MGERNVMRKKVNKNLGHHNSDLYMKEKNELSKGKEHYEKVKMNIPSQFLDYVKDIKYVRNGRIYETLLKTILEKEFGVIKISIPRAIFPIKRKNGRMGGYLHPDLKVNDNIYIEVTTWGDSNMIFSKLMQGYLLKKEHPEAKYYVVIADYGLDYWTWTEDKKEFWDKWNKIEEVKPVDDWFGFKGVDKLVKLIAVDLK